MIAVVASMTSCINDYAECKEPLNEVSLNFKIISSNVSFSRADNYGHDEHDSDWPEFEDNISEESLAFFIFGEASDGSWPLLLRMTDLHEEQEVGDADVTIEAFPGFFNVKARIESDKFQNILGRSLRWGTGSSIRLRVVAIANTKPDYSKINSSTFSSFINGAAATEELPAYSGAKDITFAMSDFIKSGVTGDINVADYYQGSMPMYGLGEFTISDDNIIDSNKVDYAMIGEVHLQRALAKVCVIDNIENRNPDTLLPRIESVAVRSRTQLGYVLPQNPLDYENNDLPNPIYQNPIATVSTYLLGYQGEEKPTSPEGLLRFGYLPEQQYSEVATGSAPAPDPYIIITVTFAVDEEGNPTEQKTYYVPFTGYDGESFSQNFGEYLLRNHIYTLSVDRVRFDTDLELTLRVKDWDAQTTTWDYSDNPGLAEDGYLQWQSEQLDLIAENAEIYYSYPLTGTFTFAEPKGGKWFASFMPLTETTNPESFMFENEDGELVSSISGDIDGSSSTIKIVAKYDPGEEDRKVRLIFTVETPDKRIIPADVLGGNYGDDNKYFTIIQNAIQ